MPTTLHIDVPFLPLEEYARRTGQSVAAVAKQADRGQLPIVKLEPESKKRGKRFVNMVALFKSANKEEFVGEILSF